MSYGEPLTYGKTRLLNLFAAADRTLAGFGQPLSFPELEPAFFTRGRSYEEVLSVFAAYSNMFQMVEYLFF